jgi:ComF family protein
MRRMIRSLLDLLLPPTCPGCGTEGLVLCDRCGIRLARRLDEPPGMPIGLPRPLPVGLVQLEWCASFEGPVRAALHALKYRGERRLAEPLGRALAARWSRAGLGSDAIVPVPVHPRRRRERGFDQAEDLAQWCGRALGLPVVRALERRQRTVAQHALGQDARQINVAGAFAVRPDLEEAVRGRRLVLVDDVMTTGSTLSGCAAALLDAGAVAVAGLTVARER